MAPSKSRTLELAQFASAFSTSAIPEAVIKRAQALMTDFVGSVVRAASDVDSSRSILAMVDRLGLSGPGDCRVFGLRKRYGAGAAALLNGAFGHSLDFDDTHADSSLHPSAPVVPAALAAAELCGAPGTELLGAIVIGYEVCCRLGLALDPTAHYARGFHPTATAGIFGACAAAGRILGLDAQGIASAFGIAASQASGSLQFLANGGWNKRYQVGEAAMKGLIAASLATEGFFGASDGIDGQHGLLTGYTGAPQPSRATEGLGQVWETMRIGIKPYPSCRYTHAAVDGLLLMVAEHGLWADDIVSVTVGLHRNGMTLVGEPLVEKRRPRSIVDGQFSMPFALTVALLRGGFGWDDYALLGGRETDAFCDRVTVVQDPRVEGQRHPFGATLKVKTRFGISERIIADPSGEPETFPSDTELAAKFHNLTAGILGVAGAEDMLARLRGLYTADCVDAVLPATVR